MALRPTLVGAALVTVPVTVLAHTPLLDCYENDDGSITCEGGFSDGASAAGVTIRVIDETDRVKMEDALDASGQITFARPDYEFHVVFDAGDEHIVILFGYEIE